jgi:hypothetical protein
MRAFVLAMAAMAVISVGAWYGLHQLNFSTAKVDSASNTRL